jgi:hypothetical protein
MSVKRRSVASVEARPPEDKEFLVGMNVEVPRCDMNVGVPT